MVRTLETARLTHRALVALCVVAIATALGRPRTEEGALRELTLLLRVRPAEFEEYVREREWSKHLQPFDTWFRGYAASRGYAVSDRCDPTHSLELSRATPLGTDGRGVLAEQAELVDLINFEDWPASARLLLPDTTSLRALLDEALPQSQDESSIVSLLFRTGDSLDLDSVHVQLDMQVRVPSGGTPIRLPDHRLGSLGVVSITPDAATQSNTYVIKGPMRGRVAPVGKSSFVDYVRQREALERLAPGGAPMPHVNALWTEVRDLTVEQAMRNLSTKRDGGAAVTLLGVTMAKSLAGLLAPAAITAFLLSLLIHTRRLAALTRAAGRRDLRELASFPWAPLYPGRLPALATVGSILILGPVTELVLGLTADGGVGLNSYISVCGFASLCLAVLIRRSMLEIRDLLIVPQ